MDYDTGGYSPKLLRQADLEIDSVVYDPTDDMRKLELARQQVLSTGRVRLDGETEFEKKAREGMNDDEATFSVEVPTEHQKFLWSDKYRPRKPRFFNRVHTGFEWNKYNQTHYDIDNPPPKIENNCQPGFQGFCLPWVGKGVIAGCINTTGLQLDGEKCLQVTYVVEHNKYKADCHDKKCPNCINANSLEERLKMCLFQNETSGDSQSIECSPENSSTRSGCVQPTCWIPGLAVVLLLVHVLTIY